MVNAKVELLHDWKTANNARRVAALEDEAALAAPVDVDSATPQPANEDAPAMSGVSTADLDAEFERLVMSPVRP